MLCDTSKTFFNWVQTSKFARLVIMADLIILNQTSKFARLVIMADLIILKNDTCKLIENNVYPYVTGPLLLFYYYSYSLKKEMASLWKQKGQSSDRKQIKRTMEN